VRNGALAGVGRSREIRRYEMRANIGERRSSYQSSYHATFEMWIVPRMKEKERKEE